MTYVKHLHKVDLGLAEIPDYQVEKCIKKKEGMIVEYKGQIMTLSYEDLTEKRISVSRPIASKYETEPYTLYRYHYQPDTQKV